MPSHPSAVVWINRREAIVASTQPDGAYQVQKVNAAPTARLVDYLDQVVDVIGDRERVLIQGPSSTRTRLEREYVSVYDATDRLIDVEPAAAGARDHVVERLFELAA